VPLADVNGKDLNALVRGGIGLPRSQRLAAALATADAADGGLPAAIGRPATRALHGAEPTSACRAPHRGCPSPREGTAVLHGVGIPAGAGHQAGGTTCPARVAPRPCAS